jgi:hypothetical protein
MRAKTLFQLKLQEAEQLFWLEPYSVPSREATRKRSYNFSEFTPSTKKTCMTQTFN